MQNLAVSPDATGLPFIANAPSLAAGPRYWTDRFGFDRDFRDLPITSPGTITPLGFVEMDEENSQTVTQSASIGIGLAAAAWLTVSGETASVSGRDTVLALVQTVTNGWIEHGVGEVAIEAFAIAAHEVDPALQRVAVRLATDPEFTRQFNAALAIITAGCAFFPWYRGDGRIPG